MTLAARPAPPETSPARRRAPGSAALAALLALAAAALAATASAQDGASAPPPGKINVAVVDTNKAIDASKPGKQAASRIQTRYSQLDKKLQGLQKDAQAKAEELSKAAEGLTPEEFEKRRAALQREVDSIQAETTRAEAELKAAAEEAYGPLYDRAAGIATDHAKRYGYVMVLENSDEDKAVIFADAQMVFIDITKDVTEQLDSGKGASRPAAKPSQGRRAPRARRR